MHIIWVNSNHIKKIRISIVLLFLLVLSAISCFIIKSYLSKDLSNNTGFIEENEVKFIYKGSKLRHQLPIFVHAGRYYLPFEEFMKSIGCNVSIENYNATVEYNHKLLQINFDNDSVRAGDTSFPLYKKTVCIKDHIYISLYDFVKVLHFKTSWDTNNKIISFFADRDQIVHEVGQESGKPALIRLEDVCAEDEKVYSAPEKLEKLRIMADLLYLNNVPFHVAWVPRYMNPPQHIDNDPSKNNSMYNIDFIFTLDYLINRNGVIGLHGYTHQYGNSQSLAGYEFGLKADTTEEYTVNKVLMAIRSAETLQIPIAFFEFPHYTAAPLQISVVERYFDYIYQADPSNYKNLVRKSFSNNRIVKYIPTPLDYIQSKENVDEMLNKVRSLRNDTLASFFFHPQIEYEYIDLVKDIDGYPTYKYSNSSILHRLITEFQKNGYCFVKITSLN